MVFVVIAHMYAKEGKDVEEKIRGKLIEASKTYLSTDSETLSYHAVQSTTDPRAWTLFERYQTESSFALHAENPYYKPFQEFMVPLIEMDKVDIRQYNEV
ncbi:hypothetical protein FB45DRAFT_897446 [Roridomyces roridus]|uniref:ABM domain-containing protein n=1 Tax=Roridomyces roridus TaxID=1738132 RepID=A0AAD7CB95_9AGAR|nr:hypothetical protein FB45DRAFT_897446 [Roridomyces roridus]